MVGLVVELIDGGVVVFELLKEFLLGWLDFEEAVAYWAIINHTQLNTRLNESLWLYSLLMNLDRSSLFWVFECHQNPEIGITLLELYY